MKTETCGNCRYFNDFGRLTKWDTGYGECYANPPTVLFFLESGNPNPWESVHPDVHSEDIACRFFALKGGTK